MASKAGQVCQIELLLVYGADPAAIDLHGKTAADCAKLGGYHGLANRLNNAQYELTDRISYYLSAKLIEKQYMLLELHMFWLARRSCNQI